MRQRYWICIIVLACLSACNRNDGYYRSVDPAAKAHIDWRPGSYWIMQDSASGALDSFYVASYKEGISYGNDESSNETINISIKESGLPFAKDTLSWYINLGSLGNVVNPTLGAYLLVDKSFDMSNLVIYSYPLFTFTINHIIYRNVRLGAWSDKLPTYNYLTLIMHDTDGFVYINIRSINFNHTWLLIRNKIVHGS